MNFREIAYMMSFSEYKIQGFMEWLKREAVVPDNFDQKQLLDQFLWAYQHEAKYYDKRCAAVVDEENARNLLLNTGLQNKNGKKVFALFTPNQNVGQQPWAGVRDLGTESDILKRLIDRYKRSMPGNALYTWAYTPKNTA